MIIHGNEDDLSSSDESDENIDKEGFETKMNLVSDLQGNF